MDMNDAFASQFDDINRAIAANRKQRLTKNNQQQRYNNRQKRSAYGQPFIQQLQQIHSTTALLNNLLEVQQKEKTQQQPHLHQIQNSQIYLQQQQQQPQPQFQQQQSPTYGSFPSASSTNSLFDLRVNSPSYMANFSLGSGNSLPFGVQNKNIWANNNDMSVWG